MRRINIAIILLSLLISSICYASPNEADELTARELLSTTRGYALGNAMTAAAGTTAIWHNPAAISSAKMGTFDADYMYDNKKGGHGAEINLMDAKSNDIVGAGIGVMYQYASPEDLTRHIVDARLGISVSLADNILSLGVTALYNYMKLDGKKTVSQFSMDVGIIIRPLEWLSLGFSAQNLIVGDYEAYMPRMIAAGISAGSLELGLSVMFDASFNISAEDIGKTGSYGVGVEYSLKQLVPIRLGYRYEMGSGDHHVLTAGLGYRQKEGVFGLDLSYQHHFADFSNEVISGSLDFYF